MRIAHHPEAAPGSRFLDPAVLARIGSLELLARTVVEGFVAGLHRSPHLGLSTDFAEHRAYMPGDDTRRIDWKLYARTDRYYVKEFEAETNASALFVLDVSPSMRFRSEGAALSKLDYARFLVACLAHFGQGQRDRVGVATFDRAVIDYVPPSTRHLPHVLHTLERAEAAPAGENRSELVTLEAPMRQVAEHARRRGIVIVVSDLYDEPGAVSDAVSLLRARGSDVSVFQVLDPAELDFPYDEAATFRDAETGETLPVIPDKLAEKYRAAIAGHVAETARLLGESGVDHALLRTDRPLDDALFAYLANRQRLARVR